MSRLAYEKVKKLGYHKKPYENCITERRLTPHQRLKVNRYVKDGMKHWFIGADQAPCTTETIEDSGRIACHFEHSFAANGATDANEGAINIFFSDDEGRYDEGRDDGGRDDEVRAGQLGAAPPRNEGSPDTGYVTRLKCSFLQCKPPPSESLPFVNKEHFERVLLCKRELMLSMLTSFYFEDKGFTSEERSLVLYGNAYRRSARMEHVERDFFDRFSYEDFYYLDDKTTPYGFLLYPTHHLHVLDESKWREIVLEKSRLDKKFKELEVIHKNFSPTHMIDCLHGRSQHRNEKFVYPYFKMAWNLQADGDQTNATLTNTSLNLMISALQENDCLSNRDVIVDIGSSYNSLMWYFAQGVHRQMPGSYPVCLGYEYSLYRHCLGTSRVCEMLRDAASKDLCPVENFNVHAFLLDLFEINSLGNGITIAFQFDKAFVIELCIHTLLCALASKDLKIFITCKPKTENTRSSYDYQQIIQQTNCFQLVTKLNGCKMNGGESAKTFYVWKRTSKPASVDMGYIDTFANTINLDKETKETVMETWRLASEPPDLSPYLGKVTLQEQLKNYDKESKKALKKLNHIPKRVIDIRSKEEKCHVAASGGICCKPASCPECRVLFLTDNKVKQNYTIGTTDQKGSCVVTQIRIKKGSHLFQYRGRKVSGVTQGKYLAKLSHGIFLDANDSKCIARNVNHSCKPNSKLNKIFVGDTSTMQLWITAIEDIEPNTEITIHYGTGFTNFFSNGKCLCSFCENKRKK